MSHKQKALVQKMKRSFDFKFRTLIGCDQRTLTMGFMLHFLFDEIDIERGRGQTDSIIQDALDRFVPTDNVYCNIFPNVSAM
jgi:hypothetical protein